MPGVQSTGAKNRKYGRNANFCLRYFNESRRNRNKLKKLRRHIRRNAKMVAKKASRNRIVKIDGQAVGALKRLTA